MDKLLKIFFENDRWEKAIETGVDKGINKGQLRKLCSTDMRIKLLKAMAAGNYEIAPPHQAEIPKDDGTMRIVYVNEGIDRVVLSIANDMLFELLPETIHKSCKSYQKGIGCGKVVQHVSKMIADANGEIIGWKSDLSKYFDSVPIEYIDKAFDQVEQKFGKSCLIDVLRKYYHTDLCFDVDGNLIEHYQSLKQGCAVAAWLADTVLYHIDDQLSKMDGYYVRYSDDTLFVGKDFRKAMEVMSTELNKMQMKLNPKKVEYLSSKHWFKFLGFSIKGSQISMSKKRLKTFQKEIEKRTIKSKEKELNVIVGKVNNYLYKGNGEHAWGEQVLGIVNSTRDLELMNDFVMDCIRASVRGKRKVGGLGYENHEDGVVTRGIGQNVKANREKTEKEIPGYKSLVLMRNAILGGGSVYRAVVLNLYSNLTKIKECNINVPKMSQEECLEEIEMLYQVYKYSVPSELSSKCRSMFYAEPVDNLTMEQMCTGEGRIDAKSKLERFVIGSIKNGNLKWNDAWGSWYHCGNDRDLVLFKEWFD